MAGIGAGAFGSTQIYPDQTGHNLVWKQPWPPETITYLVSLTNMKGMITNSDLELAALIIYEATLLAEVPESRMAEIVRLQTHPSKV